MARRAVVLLSYAIASLVVIAIFLHSPGIQHHPPSSLERMVYGTAHKPFVYRALVPTVVRVTTAVIPARVREQLVAAAETGRVKAALLFFDKIPPAFFPEFVVAVAIMYGALLGFCFALRYLFNGLFRAPERFVEKIPLLALLLLPPFFQYTSFLYDFPALLLFTLSLALMVRRSWGAYLAIFVLACLNKETAILLTLIFAVHFFSDADMPRSRFVGLLAAQVVVFVAVKTTLNWLYRNNPGAMVEFHLVDHNVKLLVPYSLATAVSWLAIVLLTLYRWQEKPLFLKHAVMIVVPLLGLTLFLGYLDELRDYYEAFPIVLLLVIHGLARLGGVQFAVTAEDGDPHFVDRLRASNIAL